jgi:cell pole-organizing protein PopZ
MSAAAPKSLEPTMEEILASIRRIITDEQGGSGRSDKRPREAELPPAEGAAAPVAETGAPPPLRSVPPPVAEPTPREPSLPRATPALTPVPVPVPAPVVSLHRDYRDPRPLPAPAAQVPPEPASAPPQDEAEEEPVPSVEPPRAALGPAPAPPPWGEPDAPAEALRGPVYEAAPEPPAWQETERPDTHAFDFPLPPQPRFATLAPAPHPAAPEAPLLSGQVDEQVGRAFGQLSHAVLGSNARTIEDLVRDMLRPMLKAWLDDNLPTIVERLVRAEIERVARGR